MQVVHTADVGGLGSELTAHEHLPEETRGASALSLPGRAVVGVSRLGFALAAVGVVFMAVATVYEVIARYAFGRPTTWSTEVSTYVLIVTIFLGAAGVHLADGHVRVDLLVNKLKGEARRRLLLIAAWLGLLFVAIAAWQAGIQTISKAHDGSRLFTLLLTPGWIPNAPIAVGLTLLAAAFLVEIERIAGHGRNWRSWFGYALFGLVVVPMLIAGGLKPPTIFGTRFDLCSLAILLAVFAGAFATGGWRVGLGVIGLCLFSFLAFRWGKDFGVAFVTAAMIVSVVVYLSVGVRIAFALGIIGAFSVYFLTPIPFPVTIAERAFTTVNSFALTAVPLYVLMGTFLVRSGLSDGLFSFLSRLLGWLPGGLAHPAVAGCAVFAAVSGSSVATAATIGSVACPEMHKRGYDPRLTYGSIAAGGTLGILIPPSVPLIIYGITVGAPITTLFIAGIVPGLMIAALFLALIYVWGLIDPKAAPQARGGNALPVTRASVIDTLTVMGLIALVIVALYGGFATASETGAIAAVAAFVACWARRKLTWVRFKAAVGEAVVVTSFIFLIVVGATIITYGFEYLKVSEGLMAAVSEAATNRWVILAIVIFVYLILGMFLDSISMMVLTLPVVFPMAQLLGFDPVWFGIVVVITAEIGLITPPVGMNLFVLQGIDRRVPIRTIALGSLPFLAVMLLSILLLCLWPDIALWLTRHIT